MAVRRRILRTLGWGAAAGLIGIFLIGYAAPHLSPARFWWADLAALLVPTLGVMVGVLAVGLLGQGLYRRAWGRTGSAVILLGLLAVRFGPSVAIRDASGSASEALRVMTFNVPPSQAQDSASAAQLRRLMQQEAPDVLALQEAWITTGAAGSKSELAATSGSASVILTDSLGYAPPRAGPLQTTIDQPVLGRFALDSVSVHPLPPDGDANPRARYTRVAFRWQGREAVLYNVHLHTVGVHLRDLRSVGSVLEACRILLRTYRAGALRRAEQARVIRRHIEQETRPVLVVGDFNSTRHQWAYRHIAEGLRRTGTGGTFPARRPLVRIDHVLAGPAWEVVSARVPALDEDAPISDHRPVAVQLRWRADYSE